MKHAITLALAATLTGCAQLPQADHQVRITSLFVTGDVSSLLGSTSVQGFGSVTIASFVGQPPTGTITVGGRQYVRTAEVDPSITADVAKLSRLQLHALCVEGGVEAIEDSEVAAAIVRRCVEVEL